MAIRVNLLTARLPFPLSRVRRAAAAFLKAGGVPEADLSIVLITDKAMRELNRKSLGHDYVTDVVTFDLSNKTQDTRPKTQERRRGTSVKSISSSKRSCVLCPVSCVLDGEIYICPAEARRNAKIFGETFEREVLRYVAHGILHLFGHDDRSPEDRRKMRVLEDRLLAALTPVARKHG